MTEQHYVCARCDKPWSRPAARGRVPRFCPDCRTTERTHRLARCLWCDHLTNIRRGGALYCSRQCASAPRMTPSCPVPQRQPPREARLPAPIRQIECTMCATVFTTNQPAHYTCSTRCQRKGARLRRRTREAGSYGEWRWSDFMRIARRFDYRCAYCGTRPDRLDPDHVVPLSRGGPNTTTNLLPTCAQCNSDKSAHSLTEWAAHRTRRGLPPVLTQWDATDSRFWHLTHPQPARHTPEAA